MVEWKTIDGFPNYIISSDGEIVRSVKSKYSRLGNTLTHWVTTTGYPCVTITSDKKYSAKVHRLVAKAFVPNPHGLPVVNHKDGDKLNCKADNLEWVTGRRNLIHAIVSGLRPVKGYGYHRKARKWAAYIESNGKKHHLGLFLTEAEAKTARMTAEETLWVA